MTLPRNEDVNLTALDVAPAPWTMHHEDGHAIRIRDAEGVTVVRLSPAFGVQAQYDAVEALAPLIAAAPDLLAVAERIEAIRLAEEAKHGDLVTVFDVVTRIGADDLDAIRAAIAKARPS